MSEVFKKDRYTILDGAMGTMLQKSGLELGRQPDVHFWCEQKKTFGLRIYS